MTRISRLDGLRGIAILMVFLYHALFVPLLWSGVDLFFVLSGYLITGILLRLKDQPDKPSTDAGFFRPFYLRRALRILPPYLVFLLMVGLFFPIPWRHVWFWYAFFAANFANAFQQPSLALVPLWSLAVEEQFYLVWPWVARRTSRKTLRNVSLGIIMAAPVLRAICTLFLSSNAPIYTLTPFRADLLACGAFIAISESENPVWIRSRRRLAGMCALTAGIVLAALSTLPNFHKNDNTVFFNTLGYSLFVIIFGGTLIWVLGSPEGGGVSAVLSARPLRYLGLISYTFYLYHQGVLILVGRHLHSVLATAVVSFAITTAISAGSWSFFESRILRKHADGRRQRTWGIPERKLSLGLTH